MVLTTIVSAGMILVFTLVLVSLWKWGNVRCIGTSPVPLFTFMAILFTSGLDVGLIMFPLTEFPAYGDTTTHPEYAFTNPLAIEFGFWGFLVWMLYFLPSFYFCVIEPRVRFFEISLVKVINSMVIVGTSAFTVSLFLTYLPDYLPVLGDRENMLGWRYPIILLVILAAAFSATDIRVLRRLSVISVWLFLALILGMSIHGDLGPVTLGQHLLELGGYFRNLDAFVLPLNDYHEFYLFWWFAWSIMIGQFTARFIGGLRTWQLLLALLTIPSIPIAIWFAVLYHHHVNAIPTTGLVNLAMVLVGMLFMMNSLDSLIRLYTDNLGLTVHRLGRVRHMAMNVALLFALAVLFQVEWVRIQWLGSVSVGLHLACVGYLLVVHRARIAAITASPAGDDFEAPSRKR